MTQHRKTLSWEGRLRWKGGQGREIERRGRREQRGEERENREERNERTERRGKRRMGPKNGRANGAGWGAPDTLLASAPYIYQNFIYTSSLYMPPYIGSLRPRQIANFASLLLFSFYSFSSYRRSASCFADGTAGWPVDLG
jgi:hypothetical protein